MVFVNKSRGRHCGDVELAAYLPNVAHYPNDLDESLNETSTDKIRKYRDDYNNNPPNDISFMTCVPSKVWEVT
jgi:hypothetical protein